MDLYDIRRELSMGKSIYDLNLKVTYYTRVSTTTEEQAHSLEAQINYYPSYIKKIKNWTLVEGYVDSGTGTSTVNRDAFQRMIEDAKNGMFDLILTKEVSRFARNTLDSLFYTRELLKYGVGVLFELDNINTLMPDSELRLTIMSSMAQEESRKISERVKWGHKRAMKNGTVFGNSKMWGYDKDNGKLVINEEEAKVVRMVFDLYANAGLGFRRIGEKLQEMGYYNRNGNPFSYSTLRYMIANPKYKGYFVGNRTTTLDYLSKERKILDEDEWIIYKDEEGNVPAIVSEELWNKANAILKKRSKKMYTEDKTSYQNKFLYSGKILCGKHNTTYWRNVYKYKTVENKEIWQCKVYRKKGKYACQSPMLYKHELDFILGSVLNHIWQDKEGYINKLMSIYESIIEEVDYEQDIKELMRQITLINGRKNKLLDLSLNGFIEDNEFKKRNDEFNLQIKALEEQIKKYEELNDAKKDNVAQLKYIKKMLEEDVDFIKNFDERKARQMLDKIIVYETEIENLIAIDIFLKSGIEIPSFFIKDTNNEINNINDMRLYHTTHIVRDKCMFKFNRFINKRDTKPTEVNIEVKVFATF